MAGETQRLHLTVSTIRFQTMQKQWLLIKRPSAQVSEKDLKENNSVISSCTKVVQTNCKFWKYPLLFGTQIPIHHTIVTS